MKERAANSKLRKWLCIKESALAQKARITCLQYGDENNAHFYVTIKDKYSKNRINSLKNNQV